MKHTYDLGRLLHEFVDEDVAFNFPEFWSLLRSIENICHRTRSQELLQICNQRDNPLRLFAYR